MPLSLFIEHLLPAFKLMSLKQDGFQQFGVKQGDVLSPTLFSVYVHDLAFQMKSCKLGDDLIVRIRLYADDIILLAEHEKDLQEMLVLNGSGNGD